MPTFWSRVMAGAKAFREAYMNPDQDDPDNWSDWDARQMRYEVLWSYYSGGAYRDAVNPFWRTVRAEYGLYKWTRDIGNPAYRLGQFYQSHIWGGRLDAKAGDGKPISSALPIETDNEALREHIATLWRWSNWTQQRNMIPLRGAILGDAFIEVVDDVAREKVYLKRLNPSLVKTMELDPFGHVKAYTLEMERLLPGESEKTATYTEEVTRDSDLVVYRTFRNGSPFAWGDAEVDGFAVAEWTQPYGFIPLVHIPHRDTGLEWGASELLPRLSVFREIDDQWSKMNDQIRKTVDAKWLFNFREPTTAPAVTRTAATSTKPEAGRDEVEAFYVQQPDARAQPLVAPLDLTATLANIQAMAAELEKDYPELNLYRMRQGEGLSGRAIRLIRTDAETKARDYRDRYDGALVRAQQMALAIGGMRGYFTSLDLDSYAAGALDHQIGNRPVFADDPLDEEEVEAARLSNIASALDFGMDPGEYMALRGYSDEQVAALRNSPQYQMKLEMMALNAGDMGTG